MKENYYLLQAGLSRKPFILIQVFFLIVLLISFFAFCQIIIDAYTSSLLLFISLWSYKCIYKLATSFHLII